MENANMDLSYLDEYEDAAATRGPNTRPVPGNYRLKLPNTITSQEINWQGREGIEFSIGGAEIAEGEFAGTQIGKYVRVANIPRSPSQKFSDAGDLLKNFGKDPTVLRTKDAWIDAMNEIAGEITPNPVFLTWQGNYRNSEGKRTYLKARDFSDGAGGYVRCLYLTDGVLSSTEPPDFSSLPSDEQKARRVWANLEGGYRGFAPRS